MFTFYSEGKYLKAVKRLWALNLYRLDNVSKNKVSNTKILEKIFPILVSDLALLNNIVSDIDGILMLLRVFDNKDLDLLKVEIDNFIHRLSNVYTIDKYIKIEPRIIKEIHRVLKCKTVSSAKKILKKIYNELKDILNIAVLKQVKKQKLDKVIKKLK